MRHSGTNPVFRAAPSGRGRRGVAAVLLLVLSGLAAAAVPEYEVKAALIYKIGKFVRWPEGSFAPGGNLNVCIVGRDDFGGSMDTLSGQRLQGRTIVIERIATLEPGATDCQIAFISRSERPNLAAHLAALARTPILTISDIEGFAALGGIVGFATADSKITFQINPAAGRRAGIEIGAQLLQFALLVTDDRPGAAP